MRKPERIMRAITMLACVSAMTTAPTVALAEQAPATAPESGLVMNSAPEEDESLALGENEAIAIEVSLQDGLPSAQLADADATIEEEPATAEEESSIEESAFESQGGSTSEEAAHDESVIGEPAEETDTLPDQLELTEGPANDQPAADETEEEPAAPSTPSYSDEWVSTSDGYVYYNKEGVAQVKWVVTQKDLANKVGAAQRYWVDPVSGRLLLAQLIQTESNIWAYARPEGYVVRGKYIDADTGYVYFADNDGKLETPGWHVTNKYGDSLQRYWIDEEAHAAVPGYSPEGYDHYTRPEGYVVRGKYTNAGNGYVYLANGDGKLEAPGWHVTNKYGDGLQRYWVDEEAHAAVPGYSSDGYDHYTRKEGYVLRGSHADPKTGYLYLANNDGKLERAGWLVTNRYDANKKLQRYYIDPVAHAVVIGHNVVDNNHYYALPKVGYMLRGKLAFGNGVLLADNDGKLAWAEGWLVTKAYDTGLQRYRIDGAPGSGLRGAHVGVFTVAGRNYYGLSNAGYVSRGMYVDTKTNYIYLSDNDGRLEQDGWLVTNRYDAHGKLQRYYIDPAKHAAVPGHVEVSGSHYYVMAKVGYVLRGKLVVGKGMLLADNNGKLAWNKGWLVTSVYDGKLQRYMIGDTPGNGLRGATLGSFTTGGKRYYATTTQGYVTRNAVALISGKWYHANNDGVLSEIKSGKYGYQNPAGYYQLSAYTVVLPDYCTGIFGYVSPIGINADATREQCVEAFIACAYGYLGTGYVWDYACAPGVGVDCAGLVLQCMYAVGITPTRYTPYDHYYTPGHDHYANDMRGDSRMLTVSLADRRRGDLICYSGHIGIYLGNNQIIHAYPNSVFISSMYYNGLSPISVKRVFI